MGRTRKSIPTTFFNCSICLKRFFSKTSFREHEFSHVFENNYKCLTCDKLFSHKKQLATHVLVHEKETITNSRSLLTSEGDDAKRSLEGEDSTKTVTPFVPYDPSYQNVAAIIDKPYTCSRCGKSYKNQGGLSRHQWAHSETELYKSKKCSKSFVDMYHLSDHYQTHLRVKSFHCNICGKSFSYQRNLNRHQTVGSCKGPRKTKSEKVKSSNEMDDSEHERNSSSQTNDMVLMEDPTLEEELEVEFDAVDVKLPFNSLISADIKMKLETQEYKGEFNAGVKPALDQFMLPNPIDHNLSLDNNEVKKEIVEYKIEVSEEAYDIY